MDVNYYLDFLYALFIRYFWFARIKIIAHLPSLYSERKLEHVRRVTVEALTAQEYTIMCAWTNGQTPTQIATELKLPIELVYKRIRQATNALIEAGL